MATASWPACSRSGTTRCQYQAAPPAPGTSANVVTVHMLALDGAARRAKVTTWLTTPRSRTASPRSSTRSTACAAPCSHGEITVDEEHARLRSVEVELDQCWDLLRQRRAKREFGQDPDDAEVRSERTVEGYTG